MATPVFLARVGLVAFVFVAAASAAASSAQAANPFKGRYAAIVGQRLMVDGFTLRDPDNALQSGDPVVASGMSEKGDSVGFVLGSSKFSLAGIYFASEIAYNISGLTARVRQPQGTDANPDLPGNFVADLKNSYSYSYIVGFVPLETVMVFGKASAQIVSGNARAQLPPLPGVSDPVERVFNSDLWGASWSLGAGVEWAPKAGPLFIRAEGEVLTPISASSIDSSGLFSDSLIETSKATRVRLLVGLRF